MTQASERQPTRAEKREALENKWPGQSHIWGSDVDKWYVYMTHGVWPEDKGKAVVWEK